MKLLDKIIIQAKKNIQTIVLPEGKDKRIQEAARVLKNENILNVVVLVNEKDIDDSVNQLVTDGVNVIEPELPPLQFTSEEVLLVVRIEG